jgi:hypothetical protein
MKHEQLRWFKNDIMEGARLRKSGQVGRKTGYQIVRQKSITYLNNNNASFLRLFVDFWRMATYFCVAVKEMEQMDAAE